MYKIIMRFVFLLILIYGVSRANAGDIISSIESKTIYYQKNDGTKIPLLGLDGNSHRLICKRGGYIWFQFNSPIIDSELSAIYRFNEERMTLDMLSADGGKLLGVSKNHSVFDMNLGDEGKGIWILNLDTLSYKPIELNHDVDGAFEVNTDGVVYYKGKTKHIKKYSELWKNEWWQPETPPVR